MQQNCEKSLKKNSLLQWDLHRTGHPATGCEQGIVTVVLSTLCYYIGKGNRRIKEYTCTSWFVNLEKLSLNFSSSSFAIRVNLLHPYPSLFLFWFILTSLVFVYLNKRLFRVLFYLKAILCDAKNDSEYRREVAYISCREVNYPVHYSLQEKSQGFLR